jgi:adenosylmethionine-8-amino-7-oxononanoate aminotransferase
VPTPEELRRWDNDHVWHPFAPMQAFRAEGAPIIAEADGFHLIDVEGRRYLDGISSLWCNVHGHRVPELDAAIKAQIDRVSHTTLLGMSSPPSIELARRLVELTPRGLDKVFYSDSGATAVEAAIKIAFQYQRQKQSGGEARDLFVTIRGAYHGDTVGAVSVGNIDLFHQVYGKLLFPTLSVSSPAPLRRPAGMSPEAWRQSCEDELAQVLKSHGPQIAAVIMEPLVQGAAGILVHPPGYLKAVRELTRQHNVLLIADEVAVGFGRTGTMFACEQEGVEPDLMCLAKGLTGGYLPVAATLATDEIYEAFLAEPWEGKTFFHGHTFTGNPLGCAAGLASLELFEKNQVLKNIAALSRRLSDQLRPLSEHPNVAEVRQRGIMVGIELVRDRRTLEPFPAPMRLGHQVTLAARRRGVVIRPLGDVVVLMPAPAMPERLIDELVAVTIESIDSVVQSHV